MKLTKLHLGVLLFIALLDFSGFAGHLQKSLSDHRYNLKSIEASGQIVLIAIDPKSLHEISKWPWPRSLHGKLIEKLEQAGVSEIAFDIDFSSNTNPKDDTAFENALKAANGSVILPTFKQLQKSNVEVNIHHTSPLQKFQKHSWLATVNVTPGRNGQIETMSYGHTVNGQFIPSLAAILSGNYKPKANDFYINYSIQSSTVPVISYTDILNNRINKTLLKNKKAIIGVTAIELGDHVFVPSQGMISGPMLQILASETLLQNKQLHTSSPITSLLGVLIIALVITIFAKKVKLFERIYLFLIAAIIIEIAAIFAQQYANLIINTSHWHLTLMAYFIATLVLEVDLRKVLIRMMRVELANTQQMFQQVFNNSFTGTIIANQDGIIQAASKTSTKLLKLEKQTNLKGKHYQDVLPPEIITAANQLLTQADKQNHTTHFASQSQINQSNGDQITLEFILTLTTLQSEKHNQQPQHIVSFSFQDITARHKAELAQRDAILAATQANIAKNEFLSNMSHELRTPLNAIIGFSDIMKNSNQSNNVSSQNSDFAAEIKNSGEQLLKIINDILTLTKIESNSLTINEQQCDLLEILDFAMESLSKIFPEQQLNLTLEHKGNLPDLNADPEICKQMVTELLSNAIKFSPSGSEIKIKAEKNQTGDLCLTIQDYGTGISHQEIEKIFAPFYQIESAKDRHFEGTGLGLTKANAFMKLHDGNIKIESTLGHGTTIHLIFPKERTIEIIPSVIDINSAKHKILKTG